MSRRGLKRSAVLGAVLVVWAAACRSGVLADRTAPAQPAPPGGDETSKGYTGVLKGGFVGVGGEHTGWMLVTGPGDAGLEVDLSKVMTQAKQLEGKRVTLFGRMREKSYVERGKVKILEVERISP